MRSLQDHLAPLPGEKEGEMIIGFLVVVFAAFVVLLPSLPRCRACDKYVKADEIVCSHKCLHEFLTRDL
jgi:hypothetical protein